jgi:predicted DsbA family dithiol-disulfide isomerase
MIFDGKLAVSGAEPPQRLVKALDKAVEMAA